MTWLRDAFNVLRKLGIKPSAACVAGGLALQTLLPKLETKDTDIFIMQGLTTKQMQKLLGMGAELIKHDLPDAEVSANHRARATKYAQRLGWPIRAEEAPF